MHWKEKEKLQKLKEYKKICEQELADFCKFEPYGDETPYENELADAIDEYENYKDYLKEKYNK